MTIFKCKMCGGSLEIIAGTTVVQCEYCGTKQTLPRLSDERISNLYDRANHFRRNNDYDKALSIYEQILSEDRSDSEAYWSIVLCRYGIEYVEDPATHRRIPTINRAQYTSIFSDEDYKSAVLYADDAQKELYEQEAELIDSIQKGILEVSQSEEPFDVFICYKETDANGRRTQDSVLATELYNELTREGYKVFFSRITLEDKLGQEYEPIIFAALNSAKVMVVLGTRPEHFNAVWVKNEWSRYLSLIRNGARNILIPAYRDMDPYDLPEEFSHLQAQDMSKLGFMQDLTHGIKKMITANSKPNEKKESNSITNTSVESTIDYALLLIEDGNIEKAEQLLEQAVSIAPKHPMIYVGRLLIECGVKRQEDLVGLIDNFEDSTNYQKAVRFANPQLKAALEGYADTVKSNNVKAVYNQAVDKMNNGVSVEDFVAAKQLLDTIPNYADAKQLSILCAEKANVAKKETVYQKAYKLMNSDASNKIAALQKAIEGFNSIRDYKDAAVQIDNCERLIYAEKETLVKKKKRNIKILLISLLSFVVIIVVAIIYFGFIMPKNNYSKAEELFANAKYSEAYEIYDVLGNYEDSDEKAKECLYIQATALRNEKKWDEANAMFEQIKDYKDSADLIHLCNFVEVASKDPTCEAAGYKDFKCEGCGATKHSDYDAKGHNYSDATCSAPKKCKNCGKTSGSALGHTSGGTKCSRCGTTTFKTLSYSGKGSKVISNISLPRGKFRITCTMTSGNGLMNIYFPDSEILNMIFNDYQAGSSEVKSINGPITNGSLVINADDNYYGAIGWKVTIEAIN